MAIPQAQQGIPITGPIIRKNPNDTYATHIASLGKGGYFEVADITTRDAIPTEQRVIGLKVYCIAEDKEFKLKDGIDNANWTDNTVTSQYTISLNFKTVEDYQFICPSHMKILSVESNNYGVLTIINSNNTEYVFGTPLSKFTVLTFSTNQISFYNILYETLYINPTPIE